MLKRPRPHNRKIDLTSRMPNKIRKFYLEWWRIQRSTIYGIVAFVLISAVLTTAGWWAIRNDWFAPKDISEIPKDAARIISFEGDVRIIRAATRETFVVTRQTYAAAGDTIQTQGDGRAVVQMIDGSVYSVRPNSTVVIRDSTSIFGSRNVRVSLDDGQLNVRTEQQPENTENVVEMLDSETRLRSETDASFNADPRSNGGEIRISRGSVETTVGGEKATISENEFAAVDSGKLSAREKLLTPPKPLQPGNAVQLVVGSVGSLSVSFTWQDTASGVSSYHLQVARSAGFSSDMLVDRGSLTGREFRLAGLVPGTYYWRLKSAARSGQVSEWSEPARFNVVRGGSSPAIEVTELNVERLGGDIYIISGRTLPGLLVRAQGREIFAGGDGAFRLQVSTPGSEIAVEMDDVRGNRAGFILSLRTAKVLRRF